MLLFGGVRKLERQFRTEVNAHFAFLRELGYGDPTFFRERHKIVGTTLRATFLSPTREVDVQMIKGRGRGPSWATFSLSRVPRSKVSYEALDDDFFGEVYLQRRRPDLQQEIDAFAEANQSPENIMRFTLSKLAALLQTELRPIVAGQQWEKGFWTDWTL